MLEASNALLADATFCAHDRFTRAPQYGQVLVFCPFVVNIKPWHRGHFTMSVGFISVLVPKAFSTHRLIRLCREVREP